VLKKIRSEKWEVYDMWLACHTQQEIADAVGMPQPTINAFLSETENFPISIKHTFSDDFQPPLYNVWRKWKHFRIRQNTLFPTTSSHHCIMYGEIA